MQFNIIEKDKNELLFKNINKLALNIKTPILCDEDNNVYLGNSLKDYLTSKVSCVIIKKDEFLEENLYELEKVLVNENNTKRLNILEKELNEYFKSFEIGVNEKLFEVFETLCVNEENYIVPKEYGYKKNNRKKKEQEYENLFSCD